MLHITVGTKWLLLWPEANGETSVDHSAKPYEYEGSMPLVLHQTIIEHSHRVLYVIYDMCTVGKDKIKCLAGKFIIFLFL